MIDVLPHHDDNHPHMPDALTIRHRHSCWCRMGIRAAATCLASGIGWTTVAAFCPSPPGAWLVAVLTALATIGMAAVAVFCSHDKRTPFERFMLLACLVLQRPPGSYMLNSPAERERRPGAQTPKDLTANDDDAALLRSSTPRVAENTPARLEAAGRGVARTSRNKFPDVWGGERVDRADRAQ